MLLTTFDKLFVMGSVGPQNGTFIVHFDGAETEPRISFAGFYQRFDESDPIWNPFFVQFGFQVYWRHLTQGGQIGVVGISVNTGTHAPSLGLYPIDDWELFGPVAAADGLAWGYIFKPETSYSTQRANLLWPL